MSEPNSGAEALRASDCVVEQPELEIYVRDGAGHVRTLAASRAPPRVTFNRCAEHFIAHGVCIDCTQAQGRTVWAE